MKPINETNPVGRHGDLRIQRIDELPTGLKKSENVLAYGEVTGHAHRLKGSVQVFEDEIGQKYFEVGERGSELVHEEHKAISIGKGFYTVINEREYEPFLGEIRKVLD